MKSDLDQLMDDRNLDAVMVVTEEGYDAVMDYLTNGARITGGVVIKRRGAEPVLVVGGMETEEAKASGLQVYDRAASQPPPDRLPRHPDVNTKTTRQHGR